MTLNGIDISSWQPDLVPSKMTTTDFVIVKATGGTGYTNPYMSKHAQQTLDSGKLLGLYHFAREASCPGTAQQEADFFLSKAKPYIGRAVLALDWEASAVSLGVKWAKAFLDRVYEKTGVRPLVYMSKSVCNSYDWSSVQMLGYGLWAAQYASYDPMGYTTDPWTDSSRFGAWGASPALYQYTSSGRIPGYAGNLDLNLFHGTASDWHGLASGGQTQQRTVEMVDVADVAAAIHADMCEDAANGYSWQPRWGEDGLGIKKLTIGGRVYQYDRGSYDCASSVITACNEALRYTAHKDALKDATYTGNMLSVFMASGLFEKWDTASTIAQRGDVYLNYSEHTAMCQSAEPDMLSEFSINEKGGCYGGEVGDQTGRESSIHAFYERPWNCTLHWKGAVEAIDSTSGANKQSQASQSGAAGKSKLKVDGVFGPLTIKELQRQLGVKADGKFGPVTVKALQKKVGVKQDGIYGQKTKKAYRRKLGLAENAPVKTTVKALQRALNAGKVRSW